MRTLQVLTTATALLMAIAGSSLAASRTQQSTDQTSRQQWRYWQQAPYDARAGRWSGSAKDSYASGRRNGSALPFPGYGPYPDRPYGDPGKW
jgi:hypothetical protein